jgi:uncharacterized protein YkwD
VQVAAVCVVSLTLVASAPSAGAATQRHRHTHRKHHRRHHKHQARPVQQARDRLATGCPNADTPATGASLGAMRAAVVCLINQQRNSHGLPSLKVNQRLNRSAQSWNQAMINSGNFTHGANFAGRISAVGYNWQTAGENIATGFPTPRSVVTAWMASPDHCRNILDPSFHDVGTGETPQTVGGWATQPATWTQDFGLLMSQRAPSHNSGPQSGCPY